MNAIPGHAAAPGPRAALWRGGGVILLLVCLASLAVGLWPGVVYSSREAFPAAPLPTLRALAVGLVLHALLIHPLLLIRRRVRSAPARASDGDPKGPPYGGTTSAACGAVGGLGELLVFAVAAGPFFLAAAYLADAVAIDVLRVLVCLAGVYAVGQVMGSCLSVSPAGRSLCVLAGTLLALGLPAGFYLCLEFAPAGVAPNFLHSLAPVTFVWTQAGSRLAFWPQPLWPVILYLALAAVIALAAWAFGNCGMRNADCGLRE